MLLRLAQTASSTLTSLARHHFLLLSIRSLEDKTYNGHGHLVPTAFYQPMVPLPFQGTLLRVWGDQIIASLPQEPISLQG